MCCFLFVMLLTVERVVHILVEDVEAVPVVVAVAQQIALLIAAVHVIEVAIVVVVPVIMVVEDGVFTIALIVPGHVTDAVALVMLMVVPARAVAVVVDLVEVVLEHVLAVVLVPPIVTHSVGQVLAP